MLDLPKLTYKLTLEFDTDVSKRRLLGQMVVEGAGWRGLATGNVDTIVI